jgi:glycosyltransferase involved in cell wall biosynthesis
MKKVAIITSGILPVPPVRGGAIETLIDQILTQNELHNRMDITVFSTHDDNAVISSHKYKHTKFIFIKNNLWMDKGVALLCRAARILFKIQLNRRMLYINRINKHIHNQSFDKIIMENGVEFVLPVSKKCDSEIYLHIHNDYLNHNNQVNNAILESCNKVLTVSEYIKKQTLSINKASNDNVKVLKNCTDTKAFDKMLYPGFRKSFREQHLINEDEAVILFSGRLNPEKGIKELILAFNMLSKDIKAKLLIVGSTWYGNNDKNAFVNELIELSQDIKDKIVFTGYIPHADMPKVHAAADVAIVPSIWDEPAGLVVIEAMSSGLPLIATDSGGIWEYTDEQCAIEVLRDEKITDNLKTAISLLCNNPKLRITMGQAGRERALQFNEEAYFQDFIHLIDC